MRPHATATNHDHDHDHDHDQGHNHHSGNQGTWMKPQYNLSNNKHSYFLRAKTPRFLGFHAGEEDGEFKKPSPVNRVGMDRERGSSFLPSPPSKTTPFDDYMSLSEEEDLANCLVMLSNKSHAHEKDEMSNFKGKEVEEKSTFQCKACKKVFNSHQALGGHRASHKKVKGCFASKTDGLNDQDSIDDHDSIIQEDNYQEAPPLPEPDTALLCSSPSTRKRSKMHECSVCCRVFSSGQALGGHKRCHWLTTSTDNAFIPNFHDFQYDHQSQQLCKKPLFTKPHQQRHILDHDHQLDLNLNLPPTPPQHHHKCDDHNHVLDAEETRENEASTRLCLEQWTDKNQPKPGEEGCGMKLRKLSVLRDVNLDGGWLQMGTHSTSEMS
ncbi:hypothetical protein AAHA92_17151 [Salvia divinorum]|uniref:C2H2-type domain-containing protein n=1 Tax=Salvia divinorum TaxID=28513 RepID=A0ABD1GXV6_SALDI